MIEKADPYVLVLYYSSNGGTAALAHEIANGVEQAGMTARMRTVPRVSPTTEPATDDEIPASGALYCSQDDLRHCHGLAMGSPTRFGNMAAPLKYFIDQTAPIWISGRLTGKPACVFTSTSTLHGGQESTLLSMITPLMHHGMVITGIPFTEDGMHNTQSSATPYGASFLAKESSPGLSPEEKKLAHSLGKRLGTLAIKLGDMHDHL